MVLSPALCNYASHAHLVYFSIRRSPLSTYFSFYIVHHSTSTMSSFGRTAMDALYDTMRKFAEERDNMPADLLEHLNKCAEAALTQMDEHAGNFLHQLDSERHTEREVKAAIDTFPSSLLRKKDGKYPIQTCDMEAISFLPLLAREGIFLDLGCGKRGGLLLKYPKQPMNIFQMVSGCISQDSNQEPWDKSCTETLQRLRSMNLLRIKDVRTYHLLFFANNPGAKMRFNFFADWDPSLLKSLKIDGEYLFHICIKRASLIPDLDDDVDRVNCFAMILEAGIRHYPNEVGFLFRKNDEGIAPFEMAAALWGKEKILNCIQKCVPASAGYPILHQVFEHTPEYATDFISLYPFATYVRDVNNRLLFHAALEGGATLQSQSILITRTTPEEIAEKDPLTGLYPFMVAAYKNGGDLKTINYLLRRNPWVIFDQIDK